MQGFAQNNSSADSGSLTSHAGVSGSSVAMNAHGAVAIHPFQRFMSQHCPKTYAAVMATRDASSAPVYHTARINDQLCPSRGWPAGPPKRSTRAAKRATVGRATKRFKTSPRSDSDSEIDD